MIHRMSPREAQSRNRQCRTVKRRNLNQESNAASLCAPAGCTIRRISIRPMRWADWAEQCLEAARLAGPIGINGVVYAELSVRAAQLCVRSQWMQTRL